MSTIKVTNLVKKYKTEYALNGVSLSLESGKIYGLLGPNASGKTTLIKMLNGLLIPTEGTVEINGKAPGMESKKIISYMPDRLNVMGNLTVEKVLHWHQYFFEDFNMNKALEMIKLFEIDLKKQIIKLSKGTIEKLQLLITVSREADIYILDEPLAGVDPAARDYILDLIIEKFNPESMMIISTHLIADVEKILDDIIFIKKGQIILQGSADDIRSKHRKSIDELFREMFRA